MCISERVKVEVKVTVGVENLKVVKTHQNRCGISLMEVRCPKTRVKWRFSDPPTLGRVYRRFEMKKFVSFIVSSRTMKKG